AALQDQRRDPPQAQHNSLRPPDGGYGARGSGYRLHPAGKRATRCRTGGRPLALDPPLPLPGRAQGRLAVGYRSPEPNERPYARAAEWHDARADAASWTAAAPGGERSSREALAPLLPAPPAPLRGLLRHRSQRRPPRGLHRPHRRHPMADREALSGESRADSGLERHERPRPHPGGPEAHHQGCIGGLRAFPPGTAYLRQPIRLHCRVSTPSAGSSMGFLSGKRAFIVGVATDRSIAWGIAQAMHREGAELAFSYVNDKMKERVEPLAELLGSRLTMPLDVTIDGQIDAAFDLLKREWGSLDIVIHAVAFAPREALAGGFVESTTR